MTVYFGPLQLLLPSNPRQKEFVDWCCFALKELSRGDLCFVEKFNNPDPYSQDPINYDLDVVWSFKVTEIWVGVWGCRVQGFFWVRLLGLCRV